MVIGQPLVLAVPAHVGSSALGLGLSLVTVPDCAIVQVRREHYPQRTVIVPHPWSRFAPLRRLLVFHQEQEGDTQTTRVHDRPAPALLLDTHRTCVCANGAAAR